MRPVFDNVLIECPDRLSILDSVGPMYDPVIEFVKNYMVPGPGFGLHTAGLVHHLLYLHAAYATSVDGLSVWER